MSNSQSPNPFDLPLGVRTNTYTELEDLTRAFEKMLKRALRNRQDIQNRWNARAQRRKLREEIGQSTVAPANRKI